MTITIRHYSKDQEQQVLQHLSDGFTQKEIADKMGVSHRSIERILKQLRSAYKCNNNECVIKAATKAGTIS